ncbi:MAG: DNA alkylation repair protein [Alphaproteobacteria bacterium]
MEPFKTLFSAQLVVCLADHLQRLVQGFDLPVFEGAILAELEGLELKARAQLIADHVHLALPADHGARAGILEAMLHPDELNRADCPSDGDGICGWGILPLTMMVGQHGIDDFERSMGLLKAMTKRSSSEFGIRYFLLADQGRALKIIGGWVMDPNRHVRRLVSEGTRPRLPWAMQLPQLMDDPSPMLPILKSLRDDEEEYVRRSVANHLNDIAKDHPDLVGDLAKDWMSGADKKRQKLVRHACRTLIKQGHRGALEAFGLGDPDVVLESFEIETPRVEFGGALCFEADLVSSSAKAQALVIDYVVHFRKANGKLVGKVFKGTKITLKPGERHSLRRSHAIRPITTRRYYAGQHALSLRINGHDFGHESFELIIRSN